MLAKGGKGDTILAFSFHKGMHSNRKQILELKPQFLISTLNFSIHNIKIHIINENILIHVQWHCRDAIIS